MSETYRECPFCGGDAFMNLEGRKYWIECRECAAESGCYRTQNEAIKAWNTRAELTCVIAPLANEFDMGRCSACGRIADVQSNYCWKCGAKVIKP